MQAACERNEISDLPRTVAVLRAHLGEPVVACAALFWVEKNLTLPQLYSVHTSYPPMHTHLNANMRACMHPCVPAYSACAP